MESRHMHGKGEVVAAALETEQAPPGCGVEVGRPWNGMGLIHIALVSPGPDFAIGYGRDSGACVVHVRSGLLSAGTARRLYPLLLAEPTSGPSAAAWLVPSLALVLHVRRRTN